MFTFLTDRFGKPTWQSIFPITSVLSWYHRSDLSSPIVDLSHMPCRMFVCPPNIADLNEREMLPMREWSVNRCTTTHSFVEFSWSVCIHSSEKFDLVSHSSLRWTAERQRSMWRYWPRESPALCISSSSSSIVYSTFSSPATVGDRNDEWTNDRMVGWKEDLNRGGGGGRRRRRRTTCNERCQGRLRWTNEWQRMVLVKVCRSMRESMDEDDVVFGELSMNEFWWDMTSDGLEDEWWVRLTFAVEWRTPSFRPSLPLSWGVGVRVSLSTS